MLEAEDVTGGRIRLVLDLTNTCNITSITWGYPVPGTVRCAATFVLTHLERILCQTHKQSYLLQKTCLLGQKMTWLLVHLDCLTCVKKEYAIKSMLHVTSLDSHPLSQQRGVSHIVDVGGTRDACASIK